MLIKKNINEIKFVNVLYLFSGKHILIPTNNKTDQQNFVDLMKNPANHNMEKVKDKITGKFYDFSEFKEYEALSLEGFRRKFPEEMPDLEDILAKS